MITGSVKTSFNNHTLSRAFSTSTKESVSRVEICGGDGATTLPGSDR